MQGGRRVCAMCGNRFDESSVFCPIDGEPLALATDGGVKASHCVGQTLGGRYRVDALLGEGTLGEVYRARHLELGRFFAVKLLSRSLADDPSSSDRFLHEARAAGKIDHSKVVRITDFGVTERRPFFVMELSPGISLQKLLTGGLLEPRRAVRLARQIAEALRAAHAVGVVHCALKPSNILVDANERDSLKVLDFGLARVLGEQSSRMVLGAAEYMSPEYSGGGEADARSDQYSFGVVLYEMLTGRVPFRGDSVSTVVEKQLHQKPQSLRLTFPRSDLLDELEPVVLRCLESDPGNRFESMDAVMAALDAAVKKAKQRHSSLHDPSTPNEQAQRQSLGLFEKLRRWLAGSS